MSDMITHLISIFPVSSHRSHPSLFDDMTWKEHSVKDRNTSTYRHTQDDDDDSTTSIASLNT